MILIDEELNSVKNITGFVQAYIFLCWLHSCFMKNGMDASFWFFFPHIGFTLACLATCLIHFILLFRAHFPLLFTHYHQLCHLLIIPSPIPNLAYEPINDCRCYLSPPMSIKWMPEF